MKIIVALGGNAIARDGKASYLSQKRDVRQAVKSIVNLISKRHKVIITHGNVRKSEIYF